MVTWHLAFSKQAQKDIQEIKAVNLKAQTEKLLEILRGNPLLTPPSYEKLVGDLAGVYSRHINIQHRLLYQILEEERVVKVLRM